MALFAIPAGLLTYLLGFLANLLYDDPRPFVVGHFIPLISHARDNGFPSDHTLLVSSLAAVGMYWDRRLGIALWAIAILVAVSRVYVGLHHPFDVPMIGKLLGHTQPSTTARYAQLDADAMQRAADTIGNQIQAALDKRPAADVLPINSKRRR